MSTISISTAAVVVVVAAACPPPPPPYTTKLINIRPPDLQTVLFTKHFVDNKTETRSSAIAVIADRTACKSTIG